MAHIQAMDEKLQILINFQLSREPKEDVEDVLPAPVSSLEELADLCTKVADKTFKKKLVRITCTVSSVHYVCGYNIPTVDARVFCVEYQCI